MESDIRNRKFDLMNKLAYMMSNGTTAFPGVNYNIIHDELGLNYINELLEIIKEYGKEHGLFVPIIPYDLVNSLHDPNYMSYFEYIQLYFENIVEYEALINVMYDG